MPIRVAAWLRMLLLLTLFLSAIASARGALLWRVDSPSTTIWLFGTIHVGKPDMYPLPPPVYRAFDSSSLLALELDMGAAADIAPVLLHASLLPKGDSMQNHVGAERWQRLSETLPRLYHMSATPFARAKPWALAMQLSTVMATQGGLSGNYAAEWHLYGRAKQHHLDVVGLETPAEQVAAIDSLSEEAQAAWLDQLTDPAKVAEERARLGDLVNIWTQGDFNALQKLWHDARDEMPDGFNSFENALLVRRNRHMAEQIEGWLKGRTQVFVAVGALHYVGDDGLLALLRKRGYRPEPVALATTP